MGCPDYNELLELVEQRLSPEHAERIQQHLDRCPTCFALLGELARMAISTEDEAAGTDDTISAELGDTAMAATHSAPPPAHPASSSQDELFTAGTMVDHFRIMRLVGRGGMGEVYLARDVQLGRKVALKVVRPSLLGSTSAVDRFLFEARTTARFNHPHIVTIYAVGRVGDTPYVALEFLEGQDLKARIAEQRLSHIEALRIGLAVAEAMTEAHAHNILHRDLKPANILIPMDGRVRVVDFGLAHTLADEDFGGDTVDSMDLDSLHASDGNALRGTPAYMAPEQWRRDQVSTPADIWAMGLVLFELISGRLPYQARHAAELCRDVCSAEAVPRLDQSAPVPPAVADFVARCLHKDPEQRPTAAACAETLRGLLAGDRHPLNTEESPFRGLMPFTERHTGFFFGRDTEIATCVERLRQEPVLAIVGASGAGKSSLVHAGIVPRLREQGQWFVMRIRPGDAPVRRLADKITAAEMDDTGSHPLNPSNLTGQPRDGSDQGSLTDTDERLAQHAARSQTLTDAITRAPHQLALRLQDLAQRHRGRLLLVIDQLEELFTLVDDPDEQAIFSQAICMAADDATDPVRVIFTIRDDFLGRLAGFGPSVRDVLRHMVVVHSPDHAQLEAVLRRPVEAVGYRWEDDGLVDEMVRAVDPGSSLPLLQFAARMMWDRRDTDARVLTRAQYAAMGGVEGALARHADRVLGRFSVEELHVVRSLFLRLVTPERTRRVISAGRLVDALDDDAPGLLRRLTESRLLTVHKGSSSDTQDATIELAHESLVRTWKTLARWIDEGHGEVTFLNEAGQAAELWEKRGRRPDELWAGDALSEAWLQLGRCTSDVPSHVRAFLEAGRGRQRTLRRGRRGLVAAVVLVLVAVAIVMGVQKQEATEQRAVAEQQRAAAQEERLQALWEGARAALGRGNLLEARAKTRLALEEEHTPSASARGLWWSLRQEPLVWSRDIHCVVYDVFMTPKSGQVIAPAQDFGVHVLDTHTGQGRVLRGHEDQVIAATVSPDGQRMVSGDASGNLRLWDAAAGRPLGTFEANTSVVRTLDFSPDGQRIAAAGSDGVIRIWDVADRTLVGELTGHEGGILSVRYHPDEGWLLSAGNDRTLRTWQMAPLGADRVLPQPSRIGNLAFSPDGARLAFTGPETDQITILNTTSWLQEHALSAPRPQPISWRPDGGAIASGCFDGTVRVWSYPSGQLRKVIPAHDTGIRGVAFSPDGDTLVSGAFDGRIRLWHIDRDAPAVAEGGHVGALYAVAWDPTGNFIVTGAVGDPRGAILWDSRTGRPAMSWPLDGVEGMAFSGDGRRVALGDKHGVVRIMNVAGGQERLMETGVGKVRDIDWDPADRRLLIAGDGGALQLWSVDTGVRLATLDGHTLDVNSVAWHPDGRRAVSASTDRTVRVWLAETGATLSTHEQHRAPVLDAQWVDGGDQLVSGGNDRQVLVWSPETDEVSARWRAPARVNGLALGPEGHRVAVALADGSLRLWDIASGDLLTLHGHASEVNLPVFSPDGAWVAGVGDDSTLRVWDSQTGAPQWRATVLAGTPPQLLSHRGWSEPDAPATAWRRAAEGATVGRQATAAQPLCLLLPDGHLELWDTAEDRRLQRVTTGPVPELRSSDDGCLVRSATAVEHIATDGARTAFETEEPPISVASGYGQVAVGTGHSVFTFTADGALLERREIGSGLTALGLVQVDDEPTPWLVAGFRDGDVEIFAPGAPPNRPGLPLTAPPTQSVEEIAPAPLGTVVIGDAGGNVGLWNPRDGALLGHRRLHGRVQHLHAGARNLFAATDLGDPLVWDLSIFQLDRCALLAEVWDSVPITWASGRPQRSPIPAHHPCRPGR